MQVIIPREEVSKVKNSLAKVVKNAKMGMKY